MLISQFVVQHHTVYSTVCVFVCAQSLSHIQCSATLWTVALQAHLSMGLSRQEYWSGFPFPTPGDLLHPGTEPASLVSPALAGGFFSATNSNDRLASKMLCFFHLY